MNKPSGHLLGDNSAVRLVGVGVGGGELEQRLLAGAVGPLADLLDTGGSVPAPRRLQDLEGYELDGLAILLVAVAVDGTDEEIHAALFLAWRACFLDVRVICILIHPRGNDGSNPEIEEAMTDQIIDGQIDIWADATEDEMQALRWFYGGLRGVVRDGTLILEPGWDLADVVEVLDLPGSRLSLATHTVPKGASILEAVAEALADLESSGCDLALASGALLVLWRAPDQTLYARDVREAARLAGQALGQGGVHLTLTARSRVPWGEVGGCATVIASTPARFDLGGAR
ncbi:MAG: hypothetical protein EON54_07940 [Alcaligenaceae bacterium]|nr:MAG: hypothetical protein EON54_07940 [Alcaligenaceae bacterium]